jgi:hypothetical protein
LRAAAIVLGVVVAFLASEARAGCCRVVKVDTETPSTLVRVCEPDADGACGALIFQDTLAVGEDEAVCSASPTLVYQEWDSAAGEFAPPVQAMCEGGDVEI